LREWWAGRRKDHAVVAAMQQEIAFVRRHIKATQAPRLTVFCEEWGKPLIASQGWVAELVEAAAGSLSVSPGNSDAGNHSFCRPGCPGGGVVRSGRSGSSGENRRPARLEQTAAVRQGVFYLHPR